MKKQRGTYDTTNVSKELKNWIELQNLLADEELDEQTLFDTIDGETELVEALCAVKESSLEDAAAIDGISRFIDKLTQRKSRLTKTMKTKDAIILSAMERANIPNIKGPLFTISKKNTAASVIINDESEIPASFFKTAEPTLNKSEIKKALKAGEEVPGASLSNGGIALSTRII